jgi:hypothetical protein
VLTLRNLLCPHCSGKPLLGRGVCAECGDYRFALDKSIGIKHQTFKAPQASDVQEQEFVLLCGELSFNGADLDKIVNRGDREMGCTFVQNHIQLNAGNTAKLQIGAWVLPDASLRVRMPFYWSQAPQQVDPVVGGSGDR